MKKVFSIFLFLAIVLSLGGCAEMQNPTDDSNSETTPETIERITSEQALEKVKNFANDEGVSLKMVYDYPCKFLDKGLLYIVYEEDKSGTITRLFTVQPQNETVQEYSLLTKEEALQIGKNLIGTPEYEVYYDEVGYTFDDSGVPLMTVQAYTLPTQLPEADETYMRYTVATYAIHAVTGDVFDGTTGMPIS